MVVALPAAKRSMGFAKPLRDWKIFRVETLFVLRQARLQDCSCSFNVTVKKEKDS